MMTKWLRFMAHEDTTLRPVLFRHNDVSNPPRKEQPMNRLLGAVVMSLVVAPLALAQSEPAEKTDTASRVTLPLAEYDRLRAPDRPESNTVVDTMMLSGTF